MSIDAIYEPDRVADLLAGLKSRYGTYACYGNHDLDEKILAGFTFETKEERIADRRFGEVSGPREDSSAGG